MDPFSGNWVDTRDERPFSTQFAFTRFSVCAYSQFLGLTGRVLFVDCDFLFKDDPTKIWNEIEPDDKALYVVPHNFNPPAGFKMDQQSQFPYHRKLWSSLMLMDVDQADKLPTKHDLNLMTGSELHQLSWIDDEDLGRIPERWNFIPDHSEPRVAYEDIGAIHFTNGLPSVPEHRHCKYAGEYLGALREIPVEEIFDLKEC